MVKADDEAFYARCAELLGVEHEHRPFRHAKRTRWDNPTPGSGRFPGRGLIRSFGGHVHMALYRPRPSAGCSPAVRTRFAASSN